MTGLTAPSGECSVPAAIPNPNPSDLPFLELVWIGFTGILSKLLGLFDPSSKLRRPYNLLVRVCRDGKRDRRGSMYPLFARGGAYVTKILYKIAAAVSEWRGAGGRERGPVLVWLRVGLLRGDCV